MERLDRRHPIEGASLRQRVLAQVVTIGWESNDSN